jgi:hypothetical protein
VGQRMTRGTGVSPAQMQLDPDADPDYTCQQTSALQWLFVDFTETATGDEGSECKT